MLVGSDIERKKRKRKLLRRLSKTLAQSLIRSESSQTSLMLVAWFHNKQVLKLIMETYGTLP